MKNTVLALLLNLFTFSLISQIAFVKGYIVNEKGDTIKGEVKINPKKEQDNYSKVFFKDESGTQKNYKANKVKAYGFNNQNYVALDYEGELKFYRLLAGGNINFYKMMFEVVNMNATSYDGEYFISQGENKKLISVKEGKFKKQMAELMKDNTEFISSFEDEKTFNFEKAAEAIKQYNAWKASH